MSGLRGGLVLALGLALGGEARAAPLEAYGKLPFIEGAAISPDGARLAYSVTDGENRTVVIKAIPSGEVQGVVKAGVQKLRGIAWAGSRHLLVTLSVTGDIPFVTAPRSEWFMGIDYNVRRKRQGVLLERVLHNDHDNGDDTLDVIEAQPSARIIKGRPYAIVAGTVFVGGKGQLGLFKVDLDQDDASTLMDEGFPDTEGYVVGPTGEPVAESEYVGKSGRWTLRLKSGFGWKTVQQEEYAHETPDLEGLGRDGASVSVRFHHDEGDLVRDVSSDGKTWSKGTPAPDWRIHEPTTGRLIGQGWLEGDTLRTEFFDPSDQAIWTGVTKAYAGSLVSLVSMTEDHRKLIVRVDSPTEGPAYALIDRDTHRGDWLASEYDKLDVADIAEKRSIQFKAADGLALSGYLTLPRGKPAKGLPLIVLPHGGPEARDGPGFDWWAQAIASRGYAVLQVNYRGSGGYGWAHLSAGFGQWGRKMQTNLSDGVRFLAAEGTIDPKRVCIFGGSYGGYAALAGAAIDRGVYRCAVSVAGISDLSRMMSWDARKKKDYGASDRRYWLRYMGPQDQLAAISPLQKVADVNIPILLIHGKDDTVVPFEQSQLMADALHKAGKPVELVVLKKEDHWLSTGETRLEMLQSAMSFLEKNNPPQ